MTKRRLLIVLALVALTGCKGRSPDQGALRHTLFIECMNLAILMPRQADDDVSDIISQCDSTALYLAIGIGRDDV